MSKTQLIFILDRSGSMYDMADDAVGAYNTLLAKHKEGKKGKRWSLLQFDNDLQWDHQSSKLDDVEPLVKGETYIPRGMTALNDAIGTACSKFTAHDKVFISIYTDGHENSSKEYSSHDIKELITAAEEKGWEVLFMAADASVTQSAVANYGMHSSRVATGDIGASAKAAFARSTTYVETGEASSLDANLQEEVDEVA